MLIRIDALPLTMAINITVNPAHAWLLEDTYHRPSFLSRGTTAILAHGAVNSRYAPLSVAIPDTQEILTVLLFRSDDPMTGARDDDLPI
jgi:hypothetical protein